MRFKGLAITGSQFLLLLKDAIPFHIDGSPGKGNQISVGRITIKHGWGLLSQQLQGEHKIALVETAATKAGKYLLGMKEQFQPEVFFDIVTYEELYLELKIEKQSRMLLSQAGFTPDSKDDEAFRQKMDELAGLRKQIGKTGFRILSYICR